MALLIGSSDYVRTDSPTRRNTLFSWMTGLPYAYYETFERTYSPAIPTAPVLPRIAAVAGGAGNAAVVDALRLVVARLDAVVGNTKNSFQVREN